MFFAAVAVGHEGAAPNTVGSIEGTGIEATASMTSRKTKEEERAWRGAASIVSERWSRGVLYSTR